MTWSLPVTADAIAAVRGRFDGRFLIVAQVRELDIDGFSDSLALIASFDDLEIARLRMTAHFAAMCAEQPSWSEETSYSLPVTLVAVDGVRLVEERARKVKDESGFNADTRAVQLLEIAPPIIGEPLFRALGYANELALWIISAVRAP